MMDRLKELLDKIPFTLFLVIFLAWLGYQYNEFQTDPTSPLNLKQGELKAAQADLDKIKKRVRETQEFLRSLDTKKIELRRLAQELEDSKGVLTENLDVPTFMNLVMTEARKVGLRVKSLKPGEVTAHEYYSQQVFDLTFTGAFVQVIGFMDRISNLQKIVRIDDFSLKILSKPTAKVVELDGSFVLKAFRYMGSKADDLAKKGGASGAVKAQPHPVAPPVSAPPAAASPTVAPPVTAAPVTAPPPVSTPPAKNGARP